MFFSNFGCRMQWMAWRHNICYQQYFTVWKYITFNLSFHGWKCNNKIFSIWFFYGYSKRIRGCILHTLPLQECISRFRCSSCRYRWWWQSSFLTCISGPPKKGRSLHGCTKYSSALGNVSCCASQKTKSNLPECGKLPMSDCRYKLISYLIQQDFPPMISTNLIFFYEKKIEYKKIFGRS